MGDWTQAISSRFLSERCAIEDDFPLSRARQDGKTNSLLAGLAHGKKSYGKRSASKRQVPVVPFAPRTMTV